MKVRFYLKNGAVIEVKCATLSIQRGVMGTFLGYHATGCVPVPEYLDANEIVAIVREDCDEEEEAK